MHLYKRQTEILAAVKSRGACSIVDLAAELNVSDETIRRNIKPLVRQGLVEKVHGGIILIENLEPELPFERRMGERTEEKHMISALVAELINDGDSIMLDTGSTTAYVARALSHHNNLSVVTNCTEIGRTLARGASNRVHICGGALRPDDCATFGSAAINFVRQFQVDYAILSIASVTSQGEFMDYHLEEAEFSRAVMRQSRKTIVVADHTKFGCRNFVKVCDSSAVDMVVTDRLPAAEITMTLKDAGVSIITTKAGRTARAT